MNEYFSFVPILCRHSGGRYIGLYMNVLETAQSAPSLEQSSIVSVQYYRRVLQGRGDCPVPEKVICNPRCDHSHGIKSGPIKLQPPTFLYATKSVIKCLYILVICWRIYNLPKMKIQGAEGIFAFENNAKVTSKNIIKSQY